MFKYIRRNLQLYLFWFILLLPATLVLRDYFDNGILLGILDLLKGFFFVHISRFVVYNGICNWSKFNIFSFKLKVENTVLLFMSLITYVFCVMGSNYHNLLTEIGPIYNFYSLYVSCFSVLYNSFPVSLIWILIGKYLSEHSMKSAQPIIIVLFVVSGLLLWSEYALVQCMEFSLTDDCFFMLPPFCFFACVLLRRLKISWRGGEIFFQKLRNMSTIIYCSHLTIAFTVRYLLEYFDISLSYVFLFMITLLLSIILSLAIIKLQRFKYLKWLKFAY